MSSLTRVFAAYAIGMFLHFLSKLLLIFIFSILAVLSALNLHFDRVRHDMCSYNKTIWQTGLLAHLLSLVPLEVQEFCPFTWHLSFKVDLMSEFLQPDANISWPDVFKFPRFFSFFASVYILSPGGYQWLILYIYIGYIL